MTGSTSTRLVYPLITVKSENIMPVCHRALELADPKVAAATIENDLNLRGQSTMPLLEDRERDTETANFFKH